MRAYLSGAMENAPDFGVSWRHRLEEFIDRRLGHAVYNPARDIRKNLTEEEYTQFRHWKFTDLPRFQSVIKKIIHYDLDILEHGIDYVVCYWEPNCLSGGGSHGELTTAFRGGIPVYLVAGMPVEQISGWILGCCERIFSSFEELEHFLLATFTGRNLQGGH